MVSFLLEFHSVCFHLPLLFNLTSSLSFTSRLLRLGLEEVLLQLTINNITTIKYNTIQDQQSTKMATTEEEASFSPEHEDPIAGFRQDLDALVINSKPMITMLTMLADDYKELLAGEIVDCIENRLYSVPADQKLPTLYLIDSICKNLGEQSAYVTLFQRKIGGIFTHTFEASNDKTRLLLHKLRSTWTDIFTPEVLHALDLNVHRLDPNWPVVGGGPRNANRSVLPPSTSSTQPPSSAPKNGPTPKATRQPALSLPSVQPGSPTSRELIEAQLQAVRNQQRELQLYNELLLSKMKASTSNSPPEVVSSSTNNSKQQTTTAKDSKQSTVANNSPSTAKRRNASPSSEEHSNGNNFYIFLYL